MAEAGPWTKFQAAAPSGETGPWTKFQAASPAPADSAPTPDSKVYYNEAGQPFTMSGKPPAEDKGYTGTILPLRRDDAGLHLAVPEAVASPARGVVSAGMRATGVGEAGQNPLRPLSTDELAAVGTLAGSPVGGGSIGRQAANVTKPAVGALDKSVDRAYSRTVKPSGSGKNDPSAADRYVAQSRSALTSITSNKANLQFTDDAGRVVKGELPQSLEQFGHAIEQTKGEIFKKYDAMAKQAGDTGAVVDLRPVVAELAKEVSSPGVRDVDPGLIRNVLETATALAKRGVYSTSDAQALVQHLNAKLSAFYGRGGGSPADAGMMGVYSKIASKLREGLDSAIKNAVAPGYQELKSEYGALKSIEKDVTRRAQNVAKQEPGGIVAKFANVGSIWEIVHGLATLNPASVAGGVGLKAGQVLMEKLRHPDRAVQKLFETVEKQQAPKPPSMPVTPAIPPAAPFIPTQQNQGASAMGLQ